MKAISSLLTLASTLPRFVSCSASVHSFCLLFSYSPPLLFLCLYVLFCSYLHYIYSDSGITRVCWLQFQNHRCTHKHTHRCRRTFSYISSLPESNLWWVSIQAPHICAVSQSQLHVKSLRTKILTQLVLPNINHHLCVCKTHSFSVMQTLRVCTDTGKIKFLRNNMVLPVIICVHSTIFKLYMCYHC